MTTALEGGKGPASRPGRFLAPGKTRYPLYRRLGGPQGKSGQVRKISPLPAFDPQTVQPVASRYTDRIIRPMTIQRYSQNILLIYYCFSIILIYVPRIFYIFYYNQLIILIILKNCDFNSYILRTSISLGEKS